MDPDSYRKKLESDILLIIESKLSSGEMSVERAQAIAKMVLEKLHPPLTLEQIHQIAPTLDDEFTELSQAVLPIINDHHEEVKKVVTGHALKLIQSGKFGDAQTLMQQVTSQSHG
jgi:hypothetical protein